MGSADEDIGTGRSKHVGVGDILKGGGKGGSSLWVRYVVYDPPHGMGYAEITE